VRNNFGVVDANIPHYITHPEDFDAFIPRATERSLQQQIQELVCYIWDNYLQLYDVEELFLLGVGNAYLGVKILLTSRGTFTFLYLSIPSSLAAHAFLFVQNAKTGFLVSSTSLPAICGRSSRKRTQTCQRGTSATRWSLWRQTTRAGATKS